MPMVDSTMSTGKTVDGGRKTRMEKSTITEMNDMIENTFGFDFCLTDTRLRYTDKMTAEITMKNFRNSSSCS